MAPKKKDGSPPSKPPQKTAGVRQKTKYNVKPKPNGNGNTYRFTVPEMKKICEFYCDKIRQGLSLKAVYYPRCCWMTFHRLEREFPEIFSEPVKQAKAERAEKLIALGMAQATGKITGSSRSWSMMMKNVLGWTENGGVEVDEKDRSIAALQDMEDEEEMARKRLRDAVRNGEQWATDFLLKRQSPSKEDDTASALVNYLRKIDGKTRDLTQDDEDGS